MDPGWWRKLCLTAILIVEVNDNCLFSADEIPPQVQSRTISLDKCCGTGQVLNTKDSTKPTCQPSDGHVLWEENIVAFEKDSPEQPVRARLTQNQVGRIPSCAELEIHDLGEGMITLDGELYLSKYEEGFYIKEFCIDRNLENKTSVVSCIGCDGWFPCIQKCCPHHQVFNPDPDFENPCIQSKASKRFSPKFHDRAGNEVDLKRNDQYVVVGPEVDQRQYMCDPVHEGEGYLVMLEHYAQFGELNVNGNLKGIVNSSFSHLWKPGQFCVERIGETPYEFFVCPGPKNVYCENTIRTVHSIFLCISIFFLLLTLVVYLIEPTVRKQYLFSRISMAFMINLIFTYIIVVTDHLSPAKEGTSECTVRGYFIQYFFLSFFFWINAMSFNIYQKFANMMRQEIGVGNQQHHMKFLRYLAYAQGVPLLIVMMTVLVESQKPEDHNDWKHYPNMGVHRCFLGHSPDMTIYYLQTPSVLYFQVYLFILQIANIFFLSSTISTIHQTFKNKEKLRHGEFCDKKRFRRDQQKFDEASEWKKEFKIIAQLFIVTGIWWIFDFITAYISWKNYDENCALRIFLDTPNLLSGCLIFFATVFKKSVAKGLKETTGLTITKSHSFDVTNSVTKDTNLASTSI